MPDKNHNNKYSYLFAFIFGLILMVIMYMLFETTTKQEYRMGVTGDIDSGNAGSLLPSPSPSPSPSPDGVLVSLQKTSREEGSSSPSVFLGVELIPVDAIIAKELNVSTKNGVLINSVIPDSPAQKAGLERGDVIISLDSRAVKDMDDFKEVLSGLEPGERIRIVYIRDGKRDSTYAEVTALSAIQRTSQGEEITSREQTQGFDWGVSLSPLTSFLKNSFGIPNGVGGVMILSVEQGGAADEAGLRAGDVIMGVDKMPVEDMDGFLKAVSSDNNTTALLDIFSQGERRYVALDSSGIQLVDEVQSQTTLRQRIFNIFTGGSPFTSDEDEEGPKGGKFADDNISLTSDNTAFNRPSTVPGDINTGGMSPNDMTGMNRPTEVPPQIGGPTSDIVLFVGLLILIILYLGYREFHRPPEAN